MPSASLPGRLPELIPIVESVELISIYFGADVPDAEERFRRLRALPADPSPGESVLAAAASYDWLYRGGSAAECADLASSAIELATQMEVDTGLAWIVANVVLVAAERPEAIDVWDRALARSHRQGSMFGVMSVQLWRGFTELHHGELADAELSLRAGVEQIRLLGGSTLEYAYGLLASTLIRQGRVDEAERELNSIDRPEGIGDGALVWKVAEIELMLERGRDEEALAAAERHIELCGWRVNPAFAPGTTPAGARARPPRPDRRGDRGAPDRSRAGRALGRCRHRRPRPRPARRVARGGRDRGARARRGAARRLAAEARARSGTRGPGRGRSPRAAAERGPRPAPPRLRAGGGLRRRSARGRDPHRAPCDRRPPPQRRPLRSRPH